MARALAWSRTTDHVLAAGELTVHAKERVDLPNRNGVIKCFQEWHHKQDGNV